MSKRGVFWLFAVALFATLVIAQPEAYHVKLLAVQENGANLTGSDADLYLELREGSGRVFLETSLLTKLDTQGSTRFAKEVACKHFHLDCDRYDFFYTISADTNIVGGPSAGAAMAALTAIAVLELPYREDVAITGTINSGGLIGPVGGVPQKLEAAAAAGMKTVLVPRGSGRNETERLRAADLPLEVIEVVDLDAVLFYLTGQQLNSKEVLILENAEYREIMHRVQEQLCRRMETLREEIAEERVVLPEDVQQDLDKGSERAQAAVATENYYSAASFCFADNIQARTSFYEEMKLTDRALRSAITTVENDIARQDQKLALERIETLTDLQTLFIVQERLTDAKEKLAELQETADLQERYSLLSYAEERFFSAVAWSEFFAMDGKHLLIDEEHLQQSCQQKVSEAEEMLQYADLLVGTFHLTATQKNLDTAKKALNDGRYGVCLLTAAQAKAEANYILSSLGLENETLSEYIASKQQAVERIIAENSAEGLFPILGYSYYQYAKALEEEEKGSALLYLEYALEMSELGMYFPEEEGKKQTIFWKAKRAKEWWFAGGGFVVGIMMALLVVRYFSRNKRAPEQRKKRTKAF